MKTVLDRGDFVFRPPELGCVLSLPELPGGSGKVYDRSPYGNIGTITGATWKRLPGGLWCLSFDGSDDYVNCGNNASFNITDAITLLAWVNLPSAPAGWGRVMSKGYANYTIMFAPGNLMPMARIGGLSGGSGQEQFNAAITVDTWVLLSLTYDKDGGADNFRTYLNGALDKAVTHTGQISTGGSLFVGSNDTPSECFNGYIALVRVYNRALTGLEIQYCFNREKNLFGVWQA